MSVRGDRRVTTFGAYLSPGDRPHAVTIRSNAEVDPVLIEGHCSVGVRLVDGTDIRAGIVILAAGTYGSPMILMRSGIGPAGHLADTGIRAVVDLPGVGANLADHPGVDFETGWRGEGTSGPILHSIGTFRSSRSGSDGPPDLMFWLSDPDTNDPAFYLDPILLKPAARGTVRLRSVDPADPPPITLPDVREPADIERLAEGYRLAVAIANRPEIRGLRSDPAPELPTDRVARDRHIVENAYSIPHVVGTCRMGPSPGDGDVVDHLGQIPRDRRASRDRRFDHARRAVGIPARHHDHGGRAPGRAAAALTALSRGRPSGWPSRRSEGRRQCRRLSLASRRLFSGRS